jgi:hypothetical protein
VPVCHENTGVRAAKSHPSQNGGSALAGLMTAGCATVCSENTNSRFNINVCARGEKYTLGQTASVSGHRSTDGASPPAS